ncbi:MAG: ProQ/FINO family protein [Rhodospirillaceae bacterium]
MNTIPEPEDTRTSGSSAGPSAGPWHIEVLEPLRERLRTWPPIFPREPGDPILPMEVDIEHRLLGRLGVPDLDGVMLIKTVIRRYCGSGQYLAAVAREGAMRHDLKGRPIAPVSEKDRQTALAALEKARRLTIRYAPPPTTEKIMVSVKALKITVVLPADQLKPSDASAIQLHVATPEGAKALARISGKSYRRALTQIAAVGVDQAVVVLQGQIRKQGEIEGAGISVQVRKVAPPVTETETEAPPSETAGTEPSVS